MILYKINLITLIYIKSKENVDYVDTNSDKNTTLLNYIAYKINIITNSKAFLLKISHCLNNLTKKDKL